MRYMLLIHTDETTLDDVVPESVIAVSAEYAAYRDAMLKAGVGLGGARLQPASRTARVRVKNGKTEVLDGPYADTKEQFGGYYMIDVPDLDHAVAWAARCPAAQKGTVEVRPIWELTGA